jgi:hypothetical protein
VLVASVEAGVAERERAIRDEARRAGLAFVGVERCAKQNPFEFCRRGRGGGEGSISWFVRLM